MARRGVAGGGAGWHVPPRHPRSVPRLSNGSEWLFHGKDEVRGDGEDLGWLAAAGGTRRGLDMAQGTEGTKRSQGGG